MEHTFNFTHIKKCGTGLRADQGVHHESRVRTSTISSHEAKVFTGLLVGNKLLSEMKVQLQPYETECPD